MPGRWLVSWLAVACAVAACGQHAAPPTGQSAHDGGVGSSAAATVDAGPERAPRPLGMAALDGFAWRKRAGATAYRLARRAEHRDDWAGVAAACTQAVAADPTHLDAQWLLAVALAKTGHSADQIAAPLDVAVAGDLGKWGPAALAQPALQAFLATPTGAAWQRWVSTERQTYEAALAHALVIDSGGDLFAFDRDGRRWLRLTRTGGSVIAAIPGPDRQLAYVTVGHTSGLFGVAIAELATGRASHPTALGAGPHKIGWGTAEPAGLWINNGPGGSWRQLDRDGHVRPVPARPPVPPPPWLEIGGGSARVHRVPVVDVQADWDDRSLASSIRVTSSNRVISVPSPGLIDGNTATWSPDRAHLAFVAQLDEQCTPGAISAAAFVADAATGHAIELERAAGGLAVEWVDDHELAVAGDHGVRILPLGGGAMIPLDPTGALPTPRRAPRCTVPGAPPDRGAHGADDTDDDDSGEPSDQPVNAGVQRTSAGSGSSSTPKR